MMSERKGGKESVPVYSELLLIISETSQQEVHNTTQEDLKKFHNPFPHSKDTLKERLW